MTTVRLGATACAKDTYVLATVMRPVKPLDEMNNIACVLSHVLATCSSQLRLGADNNYVVSVID